jgi:hypothetical protein
MPPRLPLHQFRSTLCLGRPQIVFGILLVAITWADLTDL